MRKTEGRTPITRSETIASNAYRKIAFRLLPLLMICYVAAFLDRINIGFAQLQMSDDLKFSGAVYGLGAGLFFVGYFFFELPSNLYMHRVGAKATISRIMLVWGVISALFALVQTEWQFYLLRFFLGAAEAGFYPGVLLFITYWFPSHRRGRANSLFLIALPTAGLIGSPISGFILSSMNGVQGMAGWRWLFIVESIPSLVLGLVCLAYLTNSPREAKWLSEAERNVVMTDIDAEIETKQEFAVSGIRDIFKSKTVWLLAAVAFCEGFGLYGLSFWLPTIVRGVGVTDTMHVALVSAIPFGCGVIAVVLFGKSSDRFLERRHHLASAFVLGAGGLSVSAWLGTGNVIVSLVALSLGAAGVYSASALFWNYPGAFFLGVGTAAAFAVINSLGNLSGFFSPYILGIIKDRTGAASNGLYVISAIMIVGAFLAYRAPKSVVNR